MNKLGAIMVNLVCPNCNTFFTVRNNKERVVCKKCLEITGKIFIMVESSDSPNYKNLGDGFFQREE